VATEQRRLLLEAPVSDDGAAAPLARVVEDTGAVQRELSGVADLLGPVLLRALLERDVVALRRRRSEGSARKYGSIQREGASFNPKP
jgi:hypothetical protein